MTTTSYHPITLDSFETKHAESLGDYYELKEPIDTVRVCIVPDAGLGITLVIIDGNISKVKDIEEALTRINEYFQLYFFEYPEEMKKYVELLCK